MTAPPRTTFTGTVLDAPDPGALADFYRRLLGWSVVTEEPDWVKLASPEGGGGLAFQREPAFAPPVWPGTAAEQQMMMHLDIEVTEAQELAAAVAYAVELGAVQAGFQPQPDVRVLLDPVGHPFCLWVRT
jgi:catechol 2,3-dioxygenase-like lactoylglutathione lyase family enzyme